MNASGFEHDVLHVNVHGAAIALETKIGTGSSTPVADAVLMGTGTGTSAWDTSPTFKGAVTVGVDDTGHDVKFFGATSGAYMLWDESEDDLLVIGGNVGVGTTSPTSYSSKTLHIAGSGTDAAIKFTNTSTGAADTDGFDLESNGVDFNFVLREAGALKFWTSSAQRMTVGSNGDVGIGITPTGTAKLALHGGLRFTAAVAEGDIYTGLGAVGTDIVALCTAGTERVRVTSAGDVGIGEASPATRLVVREDNAGGRGGELAIINYASATVGSEAALSFGLENSTYAGADGNAHIYAALLNTNGQSALRFRTWNGSSTLVGFEIDGDNDLRPGADNAYSLGDSGRRWLDVWAVDGSINTSDADLKTEVQESDLGLGFINELEPVSFKWIETKGRAGVRRHYGFVAQHVAQVLGDSASDVGIWVDGLKKGRPATPEVLDDDGNVVHQAGAATPDVQGAQGLRTTELIAPLVKAVQELAARVETLEAA